MTKITGVIDVEMDFSEYVFGGRFLLRLWQRHGLTGGTQ